MAEKGERPSGCHPEGVHQEVQHGRLSQPQHNANEAAGGDLFVPELEVGADAGTAALAYAKAGFYVLPIRRGTKHPGSVLGSGWQRKSSRDPDQLAEWFTGTDYGIALHVGRSGALVFDVDVPSAVPDVLRDALGRDQPPWQSTRADVPGKGHYSYAVPAGRSLGNSPGKLGTGWGEVRGKNGIIVVAPSVHGNAGKGGRYVWQLTGAVPVLPAELAELLPDTGDTVDAASDVEVAVFLDTYTAAARPSFFAGRPTEQVPPDRRCGWQSSRCHGHRSLLGSEGGRLRLLLGSGGVRPAAGCLYRVDAGSPAGLGPDTDHGAGSR